MSGPVVAVLRSFAELDSLQNDWSALGGRFATPLLDHDWFACAAQAFHRESDLHIVIVRHAGELTAVAPMAVDSAGRLAIVGSRALNEPGGLLYASDAALESLTAALLRTGRAIVLDRVEAGSALHQRLARLTRWHGVTFTRETASSHAVPTNTTWPQYLDSLSSRTKTALHNARARAERETGPVRFETLSPSPQQVEAALDQLVQIEARGWKARNGSALATRPEQLQFFLGYARRAAAKDRVRLSIVRFGDRAVAAELAVTAYGRMWGLKLAYDERFAGCAPALQLVHHSIASANAAGLSAYEFLGSAESWQERWRPERRRYRVSVVYPFSTTALITAVHDAASRYSRWVAGLKQAAALAGDSD